MQHDNYPTNVRFPLRRTFFLSFALRELFLSVTTCFDWENRLSAIITQRELNILILVFFKNCYKIGDIFDVFDERIRSAME